MHTKRQSNAKNKRKKSTESELSFSNKKGHSNLKPKNFQKDPQLSQFQHLQAYKKTNRTKLNKERIDQMNNKLKAERQSFLDYGERLQNKELFLNINSPFTVNKPQKSTHLRSISPLYHRKSSQPKEKYIVSVDNFKAQFQQKSKRQNVVKRLKQYEVPSEQKRIQHQVKSKQKPKNKSNKHQYPIQDKPYPEKKQESARHVKSTIQPHIKSTLIFEDSQQNTSVSRAQRKQDQLLWLDNLVSIKEESFMWNNLKNRRLDIFAFMANPDSPQFQSLRWILDKLYFCSESFTNLNSKNSAHIHRQLSRTARWHVQGRYKQLQRFSDKLYLSDLDLETEKLSFDELMLVASGRLQADVLKAYLKNQGIVSTQQFNAALIYSNKQKEPLHPSYSNLQIHKNTNFQPPSYQIMQSHLQIHKAISSQEQQQLQLSKQYKQQIAALTQIEHILKISKIGDIKLHQCIKEEHHRLLTLLDSSISGKLNAEMSNERKVRLGKKYKDRNQQIKNKQVIQAVHHKRAVDRLNSRNRQVRSHSKSVNP